MIHFITAPSHYTIVRPKKEPIMQDFAAIDFET